eukprot:g5341.t1
MDVEEVPGGFAGAVALKRWMRLLQRCTVLQPRALLKETQQQQHRQMEYFVLHLKAATFDLPKDLQRLQEQGRRISYRINVSMFSFDSGSFFGNTCRSHHARYEDDSESTRLDSFMYFYTSLQGTRCIGVAEVVIVEDDPKTGLRKEFSLGWTELPDMFKSDSAIDVSERGYSEDATKRLYCGSPRMLLFPDVTFDNYHRKMKEDSNILTGASLTYEIRQHRDLRKIAHLFQPNELVGDYEVLPGVYPVVPLGHSTMRPCLNMVGGQKKKTARVNKRPKLSPTMELEIQDIEITLPPAVDGAVLAALRAAGGGETAEYRKEFRMGVHNGHTIVRPSRSSRSRGRWATLDMTKSAKNPARYVAKGANARLRHMIKDKDAAVVFELVYTRRQQRYRGRDRDRDDYNERDDYDYNDNEGPANVLDEAVVATAVLLPYDGSEYLRGVETGSSSRGYNDRISLQMFRGSLVSANGFSSGRPSDDDGIITVRFAAAASESVALRELTRKINELKAKKRRKKERELEMTRDEQAERHRRIQAHRKKHDDGARDESEEDDDDDEAYDPLRFAYEDDDDDDDDDKEEEGYKNARAKKRSSGKRKKIVNAAADDDDEDDDDDEEAIEDRSLFTDGTAAAQKSVAGMPRGSNDALVRSLLAQSLKQRLGGPVEEGQAGMYIPGRTAVIGGTTPLATELTRASKTFLSQRGFTDVMTDSLAPAAASAAQPRLPLPPQREIDLDLELRDPLAAHEVTFQFAALRTVEGVNFPRPRSVYFTFQFFNSLPTRTERMILSTGRSLKKSGLSSASALRRLPAGSMSEPFILVRDDPSRQSRDVPSLALKFLVDTTLVPGETRLFAEYLSTRTLYIDVWDGDSLLQIGSMAVDLQQLMRQSEPVAKTALEYDVIAPVESSSSSSSSKGAGTTAYARALPGGKMVARVQMLASNFGLPGAGTHTEEREAAAIAKGLPIPGTTVKKGGGGERDWRIGAAPSQDSGPKHRVFAQPLVTVSAELRSRLNTMRS